MNRGNLTSLASKLAIAAALVAVSPIGQALAHAHLTSEVPAANASVSPSPTQLTLKFSEELELKLSGVTITGPDKKEVALGTASLDPKDGATLIVPISASLAAGKYTVAWHALSKDGHKTNGSYAFTVK
jgi:methionine-rich copper-binding protein CopC